MMLNQQIRCARRGRATTQPRHRTLVGAAQRERPALGNHRWHRLLSARPAAFLLRNTQPDGE